MAYQSPEAEEAARKKEEAMRYLIATASGATAKRNAQIEKDERKAGFLRQKVLDDADVPWWKRALTGVMRGGAAGSAAGPWGALAGGIAGGLAGGFDLVDFGAPTGTDLAGAMGSGMATYRDYQREGDNRSARNRMLAMYEQAMGGQAPGERDTSLSGALDRARIEAAYGGTGGMTIPTPIRSLRGPTT